MIGDDVWHHMKNIPDLTDLSGAKWSYLEKNN